MLKYTTYEFVPRCMILLYAWVQGALRWSPIVTPPLHGIVGPYPAWRFQTKKFSNWENVKNIRSVTNMTPVDS